VIVCAWLVLALFVAGCGGGGPDLGQVTGTVTLDGTPLADAEVQFQPSEGAPSNGTTDGSGHYELKFTRDKKGALLGTHTVQIFASTYAEDEDGNEFELPQKVPARYNTESELTRNVEAGNNTFDFSLTTTEGEDAPAPESEAPSEPE
jgi:hypothetical protein